jgi:hypothetical protein
MTFSTDRRNRIRAARARNSAQAASSVACHPDGEGDRVDAQAARLRTVSCSSRTSVLLCDSGERDSGPVGCGVNDGLSTVFAASAWRRTHAMMLACVVDGHGLRQMLRASVKCGNCDECRHDDPFSCHPDVVIAILLSQASILMGEAHDVMLEHKPQRVTSRSLLRIWNTDRCRCR